MLENNRISRRSFVRSGLAIGGLSTLALPTLLRAQEARSLKVGTYGGYFQESFDKHIFPDFTAATGIEIESIGVPTSASWLVQLQAAAKANQAPADVSMIAQVERLKGANAGLWAGLDRAKMPNIANLPDHFVATNAEGGVTGVGAVAWFITLVTNTETYPTAPDSWKALWDPANAGKIGLLALAHSSFLLEITATTHFGGTSVLDTEEGILKVVAKVAEMKPNVQLWYRDEGQFQQALETGEIPMGEYYHDVTGLAASEGKPVRSTFPAEGGVQDSGSWCVSKASTKLEEAQVFIDYMSQAAIQAKLSRNVGTAPTVRKELLDLTPEEFAAVSSEIAPILPRYDLYEQKGDWLAERWAEMIAS